MDAVSALPAFPAAARFPRPSGWVTVGAGSDVGAGLAEARGRGSVPQPPAELGTRGASPRRRCSVLCLASTLPTGDGERWREVVLLLSLQDRDTSRGSNWPTAGDPDSPRPRLGRRKLTSKAGPTTLVPLPLRAPGGPGLWNGTAAHILSCKNAGTLSYHKVKIKG